MLTQNRDQPARISGHFRLNTPVVKHAGELHQPALPFRTTDLPAINGGKAIGDPRKKKAAQPAILDRTHQLFPEHEGKIGVILPELLLGKGADLVNVPGTPPPSMLRMTLDQPGADQPRQPIADRRIRHTQARGHFRHAQGTAATDQVQQRSIRRL